LTPSPSFPSWLGHAETGKRPIRLVNWDVRIFTRPKSLDLIYSIYNTFPTFLSREIELVFGRSIVNIVAKAGKGSQNGKNETQNDIPLRMKEKNCDDEKYKAHLYKMFVCFIGDADSISNERGQTEGRF